MITKQELYDLINEVTQSKYIGKLSFEEDDGFYSLLLYLDQEQHPTIIISMDMTNSDNKDEDFKSYLRKELKSRQLERTQY